MYSKFYEIKGTTDGAGGDLEPRLSHPVGTVDYSPTRSLTDALPTASRT